MDFSRFIDVARGNVLLGYRRALSNWVVERQRLIDSQMPFKLHRISAKRYVFEIEGVEQQKPKNTLIVGVVVSLAILLAIGGATSFFVSKFKLAESSHVRHPLQANASASPLACSELSLVGLPATSIDDFSVAGWRVTTKPLPVEFGAFHGFEFEATCATNRHSGRLIAVWSADGWQIKRMVLVD
jgi:hypothetical protein